MKKELTLVFVLLLLLPCVFAQTLFLEENFDYPLDSSVWQSGNGSSSYVMVNNSRLYIYGNYSYYTDKSYIHLIQPFSANTSFIVEMKIALEAQSTGNTYSMVDIQDQATVDGVAWGTNCGVLIWGYKSSTFPTSSQYFMTGNLNFNRILPNLGDTDFAEHTLRISVQRTGTSTIYTSYWDGVLKSTSTQTGGCAAPLLYFSYAKQSTNGENLESKMYIDSLKFYVIPSGNETGAGCYKNEDCLSGNCEYGFCRLKGGNQVCTSDTQCFTGICTNGKCTTPEIQDQLESSIGEWFGTSTVTFNIISIFFVLGGALMILFAAKSLSGGLAAFGWMMISTILFIIMGWLSPFFIIALVMMGLIAIALIAVLFNGG